MVGVTKGGGGGSSQVGEGGLGGGCRSLDLRRRLTTPNPSQAQAHMHTQELLLHEEDDLVYLCRCLASGQPMPLLMQRPPPPFNTHTPNRTLRLLPPHPFLPQPLQTTTARRDYPA